MIRHVLIANRGEIARRIATTCRRMGISVGAVYSDADADAPFVHEADASVRLPGDAPAATYLDVEKVVAAALALGADAIHPGYGFLAENAALARRCTEAGVVFIGPSAESIERMGSKTEAKRTMADAGVPMLPSAELPVGADVAAAAERVGYPLLVKASAGGGGKAMRIVDGPAELAGAVDTCQREARGAFGDDTIFLERYLVGARHVEVQVFGDAHGNVVHLGERECSVQRRYQKVIEESPSPVVSPDLREAMGRAAVAAATAIDYVGAGTVEFLLAGERDQSEFFFLEMNTRLQVEHPVTEMVTGLDLVRLQLLVAAGESLPPEVLAGVQLRGHAIEARLYAEDPDAGFLPASGTLTHFEVPEVDGVRVDAGVVPGSEVSVHYDPMLAKVIATAPSRAEAGSLLAATLQRTCIDGVRTNRDLLVGVLRHPVFTAGDATTAFLAEHAAVELSASGRRELDTAEPAYLAAAALSATVRRQERAAVLGSVPAGFRSTPAVATRVAFEARGRQFEVSVLRGRGRGRVDVHVDGERVDLMVHECRGDIVDLTVGGTRRRLQVDATDEHIVVRGRESSLVLRAMPRFSLPEASEAPGSLTAPMPGSVIHVHTAEGRRVGAGDLLVVLEAMKMEHTIVADCAGTVTSVLVAEGDHVLAGDGLVVMSPDEGEMEVAG
jgi:propionyl-CoA carboxylase alpha chain